MKRFIGLSFLAAFVGVSPGSSQDKKKDKKPDPQIKVILPLGAPAGKTTKLTIRGARLDQAKDVEVSDGGKAKIVSKGAAPVPDKNPEVVGDTQVVAEVTLPERVPEEGIKITVLTPDGPTKPHPLLVETKIPVLEEKEPNPGFKQSQEIKLPVVLEGTIGSPRDVDVFRFEGKAGQKVRITVLARRFGSPLDVMVSLYNQKGTLLAVTDDAKEARDPVLEWTLPEAGLYFIALIDAHDSGGSVHVYRLVVQVP